MIEPINLPVKTTGDSLTAAEFNEVVTKANAAIAQLNEVSSTDASFYRKGWPVMTFPEANEIKLLVSDSKTWPIAVSVDTSETGNWFINWGDGSPAEEHSGEDVAEHAYEYGEGHDTGYGYTVFVARIYVQGETVITGISFEVPTIIETAEYNGISGFSPVVAALFNTPDLTVIRTNGVSSMLEYLKTGDLKLAASGHAANDQYLNNFTSWLYPVIKYIEFGNLPNLTDGYQLFGNPSIRFLKIGEMPQLTNAINMFQEISCAPQIGNMPSLEVDGMMFAYSQLRNLTIDYVSPSQFIQISGMLYGLPLLESVVIPYTCKELYLNECRSLRDLTINMGGFNGGSVINISYCCFSAARLDQLFTQLPDLTGLTAGTITIYGNPGVADCNPAIATAKNWTVISTQPD